MSDHYSEKKSEIAVRYEFFSRKQKPDESVKEFVAALRKLTPYCNFTNGGIWAGRIEEALRDGLVFGVHDDAVRQALLRETNLTLDKAIRIAESIISAASQSKQMQQVSQVSQSVHRVAVQSQRKPQNKCYRCGSARHTANDCPFKDQKCFNCNRVGHTQSACKYAKKDKFSKPKHSSSKVNCLDEYDGDDVEYDYDDMNYIAVHSVTESSNPALIANLKVNGVIVPMEIDTGSGRTIVPVKVWEKLHRPPLIPTSTKLKTFAGEELKLIGSFVAKFNFSSKEVSGSIIVADAVGPALLGRDVLEKLKPDWRAMFVQVNRIDLILVIDNPKVIATLGSR